MNSWQRLNLYIVTEYFTFIYCIYKLLVVIVNFNCGGHAIKFVYVRI